MTDFALETALAKTALSVAIALVAFTAQRTWNRPAVTHILWLLLLLALLVPSFVEAPLISLPAPGTFAQGLVVSGDLLPGLSAERSAPAPVQMDVLLSALWILGSAVFLCGSAVRIWKFNRALRSASWPAPEVYQGIAREAAGRLGLRAVPVVYVTDARISPLVWWLGGRPRVVVPVDLSGTVGPEPLRWMLTHEMAHVRRRDHLVRWIEWFACLVFWWNPIVWLARRNLRIAEEMCCDAMVLSASGASPRSYARALVSVVDFLSFPPAFDPPAVASGAVDGGRTTNLERRIKMLFASRSNLPLSLKGRALLWGASSIMLSLGAVNIGVARTQEKVVEEAQEKVKSQEKVAEKAQEKVKAQDKVAEKAQGKLKAQVQTNCSEVEAQIHTAIAAGTMTEEQGKERLAACLDKGKTAELEKKLKKAVESGGMSPEEGKKAIAELHQRAPGADAAQLERAAAEIKAAIAAGTITEAEGEKKLKALKVAAGKPKTTVAPTAADCEKATKLLAEAIQAGQITPEQAREKLAAICR